MPIRQDRMIALIAAGEAFQQGYKELVEELMSRPQDAAALAAKHEFKYIKIASDHLASLVNERAHFKAWGKKNAQNARRRGMSLLVKREHQAEAALPPTLPLEPLTMQTPGLSLAMIHAAEVRAIDLQDWDEINRLDDLRQELANITNL